MEFIDTNFYPVDATIYIKENLDYQNIRLFNEYNYGSYLLFNDILVFIDSRADLYTEEFNKTRDILNDYVTKNPIENIEEYNITHVIASKKGLLYEIVVDKYELLYEDNYFAVFEVI